MTLRRALGLAIVGLVVAVAVLAARIAAVASAPPAPAEPADAAVVLGAAVWGARPSPVFAARIDHAVALYASGSVGAVVFTGGTRSDTTLAESAVARAYAIEAGVPPSAIRAEARSLTTAQNLACSLPELRELGAETAVLVSDPLHLWRARWQARDLGLDVRVAPTPTTRYRGWRARLGFLVREVGFSAVYAVDRIGGAPGCPEAG